MDVTIGTRHELGLSFVLPSIDVLAKSLPWVRVHLYFGSGPDLVLRVRTMEIDCGIASTTITDPKLDSIRLHHEAYVFVAARKLVAKHPLASPDDARAHVLLDTSTALSLFRYFREAVKDGEQFRFGSVVALGTIEAIRRRVLDGAGVAVLPEYLVQGDLAKTRLVRLFPKVKLASDWFRLFFRADDPRRAVYERIAAQLLPQPLR
jgi:DNA-binding transcriptional LysR family regulator